jgi:hypothetical protein
MHKGGVIDSAFVFNAKVLFSFHREAEKVGRGISMGYLEPIANSG